MSRYRDSLTGNLLKEGSDEWKRGDNNTINNQLITVRGHFTARSLECGFMCMSFCMMRERERISSCKAEIQICKWI